MNILYISCACSEKVFNSIFEDLTDRSGIAIQKFHRLLLEGFSSDKSNNIETLTTLPVSPEIHNKRFWDVKPDTSDGIKFNYVPIINVPFLKNTIVFFYSFFRFLFWKFPQKNSSKLVICDVLSLSITSAAFFAFKIRNIKRVGLVTDIPGINAFTPKNSRSLRKKIVLYFLSRYDGYVLLTRQMNEAINVFERPYMIMEGLVDYNIKKEDFLATEKNTPKEIIYAGGLYEIYGIKKLIEAFIKLDHPEIKLILFGTGPMVENMADYIKNYPQIEYRGAVPNAEVVKSLKTATFLVNPRPSTEEFSKYSFPSKNMEYMVSGTPLVTNLLPGMPDEYYSYVYPFKEESIDGMYLTLKELFNKRDDELSKFGHQARQFVLESKNNRFQSRRIIDFFSLNLFQSKF